MGRINEVSVCVVKHSLPFVLKVHNGEYSSGHPMKLGWVALQGKEEADQHEAGHQLLATIVDSQVTVVRGLKSYGKV